MSQIKIENLSKHFRILNRREGLSGAFKDLFSGDYRTVKAVDGISISIEPGEIIGYIGPNGAGKSTTIKMMTGILKPSDGSLLVNGFVPYENRIRFDEHMGMFNELIGLKDLYSQQVRTLSLGQRMLCDITASFLHNPLIVFLDEPTIGLDISVKAKIRTIIKELNRKRNTTILLTTHDLGDVEALCKRIIIIDKGKILYDGEARKVNTLFGAFRTLKVQINNFNENTLAALGQKLAEKFGPQNGISIAETEEFWTDITIDQAITPLSEVLSYVISHFDIADVRIVEIAMENVVQKVYDGALA